MYEHTHTHTFTIYLKGYSDITLPLDSAPSLTGGLDHNINNVAGVSQEHR